MLSDLQNKRRYNRNLSEMRAHNDLKTIKKNSELLKLKKAYKVFFQLNRIKHLINETLEYQWPEQIKRE